MLIILISVILLLLGKNDYVDTLEELPTIFWWTPLTSTFSMVRTCGSQTCFVTDIRENLNVSQVKAYLFYGSDFNYTDLPLPRNANQIWGLLHEESPKNVPYIQNGNILKYFNYTSTFSRYSNLPMTLQYLKNLDPLIDTKHFITVEEKNKLKVEKKLAPIAYLQSHCDASSGRDEYVKELMEYIQIDSYGKCLNNKQLPNSLKEDYLQKLDSDELYVLLRQYKFIIAFENAVCNDYITEKLWRPLLIGSIPIVFGSETVEDWLPNDKSAILIKNYASPESLAKAIQQLDNNDTAYNEYLRHKLEGRSGVNNNNLLDHINEWTGRSEEGLFYDFECFVCQKLFSSSNSPTFGNVKHYDCGENLVLPKMKTNMKDFYWHDIMKTSKFTAKALDDLLSLNRPFEEGEVQDKVKEAFEAIFREGGSR